MNKQATIVFNQEVVEELTLTPLTKEQAIIISGFTGITCCNFGLLHEDVEKRLGEPVMTHQFGDKDFSDKIKELYREDFLAICYKDQQILLNPLLTTRIIVVSLWGTDRYLCVYLLSENS